MDTIVLLSGKQGSGKTSLANYLCNYYDSKSDWDVWHLQFAKVIYKFHDHILNEMKAYGIKLPHPTKDGYLLQLLGTEWGRKTIGENVWVDVLRNVVDDLIRTQSAYYNENRPNILFVISDCRFENEFNAFPEALRIRLVCPADVRQKRVSMWRETTEHPSETGLDKYDQDGKFDLYLNTHSVPLVGCAELIMAKIEKQSWIERRETFKKEAHQDGRILEL